VRYLRRGIVLAALALAGCGGDRRDATAPPDVLLVTLDTFRADRAGCHGHPGGLTPALDRVFRRALHAAAAYAPAPLTAPSHASLLTGLEPPSHGVRDNGAYLLGDTPTLPAVLRERGFRTGAFVAAFPLERRFGFASGFELFDDDLEPATSPMHYARRQASAVVDAALAWIGSLPRGDRWFVWTHFFDPHDPPRVSGALRALPAGDDYERSLRGLDLEIGRLLRSLEETAGSSPIVAVVSDHGEALGGHGESSHGILLYEETTRALFAVARPATPGSLHAGIVRHADLAPTLLDALGIEAPMGTEGRSLLRSGSPHVGAYGEAWYPAFKYGWSPLLAFRDDRWTYIEGPDPELYDRWTDPAETRNVRDEHADVAARLSREIARIASEPGTPSGELLDEEARARLLALGYLGGGSPSFRSDKDPKKLVGSASALFRGINLALVEGRPRDALPHLQRAYRADPENAMAVHYLAYCLHQLGDAASAMSYYRRAIELNPRGAEAWAHLAVLEFDAGRRDEAFALLDEAFSVNPRSFPLLMTAGDLRLDAGDPNAADSLWRAAAVGEPKRPEPWVRLAELAERRGDGDGARELWTAAIDRDPNHPLIPARVR
jgi:Flp pilus assembly protein TadD